MLVDVEYLKYDGNEKLINEFYNILFEWRRGTVIDVLKNYIELKGNAVNEEMRCYFSSEFPKDDEEYFGDTGIAFYFDPPAVHDDCVVVLSNEQFVQIVREKYKDFIQKNKSKEDEICFLLEKLKKKLLI